MALVVFSLIATSPAAPGRAQAPPAPSFEAARDLHVAGERRAARDAYLAFLASEAAADAELAARAHNNLCLLFGDLGDLEAALPHCRHAVELRRGDGSSSRLARALNNEGIALLFTGRTRAARRRFDEALAINRREERTAAVVDNLLNVGLVLDHEGRFDAALEHYRRAEADAEAALARDPDAIQWVPRSLATIRINQGVVLEKLGQFETALDLYRRLLDDRDGLGDRQAASLGVNTAVLYRNLGDPLRAIELLDDARRAFAALGDIAGVAQADLNLGQVRHRNLERFDLAEADYRAALAAAREAGDWPGQIAALYLLGQIELEIGRPDAARADFEEALRLARSSESAEGVWSALFGLARVAESAGDLDTATARLDDAMAAVEMVRSGLDDRRWRGGFFSPKRPIYDAAVAILERRDTGDPASTPPIAEKAFSIVLRAKERALLDLLGIAAQAAPSFDLDRIRQRLGGRPLVEYFVTEHGVYALRLDDSGLELLRLASAAAVRELVGRVHAALAAAEAPDAADLDRLARLLLDPVLPEPVDAVVLAPDRELHLVPFAALPTGRDADRRALVDTTVVTHVPSAAWWLGVAAASGPEPAYGFVGFGDPEPTAAVASWLGERVRLDRLPASAAELEAARARVPGPAIVRVGEQASEHALRRDAIAGTRVLHLAAHSIVDPRRGAALVLAGGDDASRPGAEDGLLRPDEIADWRVQADLVVLASCHSALGDDIDLGSLGSLTGAFLAAGSRGVLASLWEVGDAQTAAVMEQLYERLDRGVAPAPALAEVQRRLRDDPRWNRPHLWAGWVLWGDPPPVAPDVSARRLRLGLVILGLAFVTWLVAGWLRRRRAGPLRG